MFQTPPLLMVCPQVQAIMQGAGPKAGAIVFSLPVTDTAGLRLLDEE